MPPTGASAKSGRATAVEAAAVVSWSGGKDSAMALHLASEAGLTPRYLLSMMIEGGARSRSHGLPRAVLEAQADALGSSLVTRSCTWDNYEERFTEALHDLRTLGAEVAVFGALDQRNLSFGETVAAAAGVAAYNPLYGQDRRVLARALDRAGWKATIVAVRENTLPAALLGSHLSGSVIDAIGDLGADPLGENGEYHTVVTDGPLFRAPVDLVLGPRVLSDGVWFLDARLAGRPDPVAG